MQQTEQIPTQLAIGQQLKQIRKKAKLTIQEVANKSGKPTNTISLIENGKQNITLSMLDDLLNCYNCSFTFKIKPNET